MKLKYIGSALNFIWIGGLETLYTPEVAKEINRVALAMNTWDDDHKFGVLFNSYIEPRVGTLMNDFFSPLTIQADSGGLQMITLGHKPTAELRTKVYENQAQYSTEAMCFDEIPVRSIGERSSRLDMHTRYFDHTMVEAAAKQTALNIIEQVETFDRLNSKTKPYIIVQGNCFETYQQWLDVILKTVPDDILGKIHGIASGAAALGSGTLEDIERYFTLSHLEAPDHLLKNFHLLGVGSPNRIVTLAKLGHLFADDVNISYDSTKHSGGVTRAQIQVAHQCISVDSRQRNDKYNSIWRRFDVFQREKLGYDFSEELFFECIMNTAAERYAKYGEAKDNLEYTFKSNYMRFAVFAFSVNEMFKLIRSVKEGHFTKTRYNEAHLHSLKHIKDVKGFNDWKRDHGRFFASTKVSTTSEVPSDLSSFFGD